MQMEIKFQHKTFQYKNLILLNILQIASKIRTIKPTFFIFILWVSYSISYGQNFSELLPKKDCLSQQMN